MRAFNQTLFFAGPAAKQQITNLKKRFNSGIILASAIQQPPHSTTEREAEMRKLQDEEIQKELEDIVKDIAAALLGREISIGEQLNL